MFCQHTRHANNDLQKTRASRGSPSQTSKFLWRGGGGTGVCASNKIAKTSDKRQEGPSRDRHSPHANLPAARRNARLKSVHHHSLHRSSPGHLDRRSPDQRLAESTCQISCSNDPSPLNWSMETNSEIRGPEIDRCEGVQDSASDDSSSMATDSGPQDNFPWTVEPSSDVHSGELVARPTSAPTSSSSCVSTSPYYSPSAGKNLYGLPNTPNRSAECQNKVGATNSSESSTDASQGNYASPEPVSNALSTDTLRLPTEAVCTANSQHSGPSSAGASFITQVDRSDSVARNGATAYNVHPSHQHSQHLILLGSPSSETATLPLLPPQSNANLGKKTLVLDLDETLVHSSFKPVANYAFQIQVEIEGQHHQVFVSKRPGVEDFLERVAKCYEVIIFTASLEMYANPVIDLLDPQNLCASRLFRGSCTHVYFTHDGTLNYIKDLSRLGRDMRHVVIVDNSPIAYSFHRDHAIPIRSWFDDQGDQELIELTAILEQLSKVDDVPRVMREALPHSNVHFANGV